MLLHEALAVAKVGRTQVFGQMWAWEFDRDPNSPTYNQERPDPNKACSVGCILAQFIGVERYLNLDGEGNFDPWLTLANAIDYPYPDDLPSTINKMMSWNDSYRWNLDTIEANLKDRGL